MAIDIKLLLVIEPKVQPGIYPDLRKITINTI